MWQHRAGQQELAGKVDVQHKLPLRKRHIDECRVTLQAGVGNQDVDGTESVEELREHGFDLVLVADIGAKRDGSSAC